MRSNDKKNGILGKEFKQTNPQLIDYQVTKVK
jgi:hypothetical protein